MSALEDRVGRERRAACLIDPATVRWSHGYGAWLPVSVLVAAVLTAVLAVAVHFAGTRAPRWARVLCCPALVIAILALFPAYVAVDDYFSFPGPDASTVSSPPCGVAGPHP